MRAAVEPKPVVEGNVHPPPRSASPRRECGGSFRPWSNIGFSVMTSAPDSRARTTISSCVSSGVQTMTRSGRRFGQHGIDIAVNGRIGGDHSCGRARPQRVRIGNGDQMTSRASRQKILPHMVVRGCPVPTSANDALLSIIPSRYPLSYFACIFRRRHILPQIISSSSGSVPHRSRSPPRPGASTSCLLRRSRPPEPRGSRPPRSGAGYP